MKPRSACVPAARPGILAVLAWLLMAAAPTLRADPVTVYGAGLQSCRSYLDARGADSGAALLPFVDWLSGFASGVNQTLKHRNNFLGLTDLTYALQRLDDYCRAKPAASYAEGAALLAYGSRTGPVAHTLQNTTYGSADKSCRSYLDVREQQDPSNGAEFEAWLGGYLSGVNTVSLDSGNVLGDSELLTAVTWLDAWCSAHSSTAYIGAVEALVAASKGGHAELARAGAAPAGSAAPLR